MTGSRRRIRDNISMDLFPFMAVLICTMGALIMLLVVMVQQARVKAKDTQVVVVDPAVEQQAKIAARMAEQQAAQQKAAVEQAITRQQEQLAQHEAQKSLAADKQQEIDDLRWQAEVLRPSYEKTVEDLAEQRLALSHIEQHTRELEKRASKMQAEADLIAQAAEKDASAVTDSQAKLDTINAQIASAKSEIEAKRKELKGRSPKFALIPYDGPSGTNRPPIYIECLADRVILQPENVQLIGEDFREPLTNANPLAMALRAKREFMLKHGLLSEGSEPYPLLVVRPGAASSYAAARSAMKAWEAEFGYELVEADIELDYKPADPRLKTLLEDMVIEARGRRRLMLAQRPEVRAQPELLRPSSTGGFETIPNGSSPYAGRSSGGNSNRNSNRNDGTDPFGNGGIGDRFGANNGTGSSNQNSGMNPTAGMNPSAQVRFGKETTPSDGRFNAGTSSNRSREDDMFDPNIPMPPDSINVGTDGSRFQTANNQAANSQAPKNLAANNRFEPSNSMGPGGDSPYGRENVSMSGGGGNASTTASGSGGRGATGNGGASQQSRSAANGASSQAQYQSLAQSRGNGWALPNANSEAVGIRRPISIVCNAEQLLLIPEKGTRNELQIFRHAGSIPAVIDPFVDAVHARIQNWGIAGQGIFWRPVLQVQVQGNADGKYRQLLQLLDRSGIEVTREP